MAARSVTVHGSVGCSENGVQPIEWKPMGLSRRFSVGMGTGDAPCPHFPKETWSPFHVMGNANI